MRFFAKSIVYLFLIFWYTCHEITVLESAESTNKSHPQNLHFTDDGLPPIMTFSDDDTATLDENSSTESRTISVDELTISVEEQPPKTDKEKDLAKPKKNSRTKDKPRTREAILKEAANKLVQKLANTKKYDGLYSKEGIDNVASLYGFDKQMIEEIKTRTMD